MIIVHHDQGSKGWLDWRLNGIGASDAPSLMGVGFVSEAQLLREKVTRRERETTFAMRRGSKLEPVARRLFEGRTGLVMVPCCVEHDEHPWLRASLDGLSFCEDELLEIKCPNEEDHATAVEGLIPEKYYPQVQYQLLVTGCMRAWYASYSIAEKHGGPGDPSMAIVEVLPCADYMRELQVKTAAFWEKVLVERAKHHGVLSAGR